METDEPNKRPWLRYVTGAVAAIIGIIFLLSALSFFISDFHHPHWRTNAGPGPRLLLPAFALLIGGIGVLMGSRLFAWLLFAANALVILVAIIVFQGNVLPLFERTNGPITALVIGIVVLEILLARLVAIA